MGTDNQLIVDWIKTTPRLKLLLVSPQSQPRSDDWEQNWGWLELWYGPNPANNQLIVSRIRTALGLKLALLCPLAVIGIAGQ